MLFAEDLTVPLTLIERYGSFGLLCVIVLAAMALGVLFLRYVKNDLVPRALAFLEAKDLRHEAHLKERDAVCAQAADTTAKAVVALDRNNQVLADLVVEVKRLKDATGDEHRVPPRGRDRNHN